MSQRWMSFGAGFACLAMLAAPLAIAAEEITFNKHVSRILQKNCQGCHRPDGVAPLSLTSYTQAKGWAAMIREVVTTKRMPPWHADPAVGHFRNDRSMSQEDRDMLLAWMDNGFPRGNPADAPEPLHFTSGWRIGEPDLVLEMPEEVEIQATGVMPYMNIRVPTGFEEDKWVQAMDLLPGNPKVVHHILVYAMSPEHHNSDVGDFLKLGQGFLIGFAPGTVEGIMPEGYAYRIPKGSTLIFQMHYTPTGKVERDRSRLALKFAPGPPKMEVFTATTVNFQFKIPPHADNHRVDADCVFPKDTYLLSMTPHMHYRGKSYQYIAHYPDGTSETLLNVPRFDFNWQTSYILAEPKFMPKGTRMETIAHFDNSANNPANPDPNKPVKWGDQTWEEMMIGWMNLCWAPPESGTITSDSEKPQAESLAKAQP